MDPKTGKHGRGPLNDAGCQRLIEAIIRRAAEDHLNALRRLPDRRAEKQVRETAAFFRSRFFLRLTGTNGARLLRMIRREAMRK